jgi:hypothetical protein
LGTARKAGHWPTASGDRPVDLPNVTQLTIRMKAMLQLLTHPYDSSMLSPSCTAPKGEGAGTQVTHRRAVRGVTTCVHARSLSSSRDNLLQFLPAHVAPH